MTISLRNLLKAFAAAGAICWMRKACGSWEWRRKLAAMLIVKAGAFLPLALISLAVLALQPSAAHAQAPLIDDASVSSQPGPPNQSNLRVSSSDNAYLKFKLTQLPANTPGSEVEKATLKIYIGEIVSAGKLDVYAVAGAWDEGTITAANAPPLGSLVTITAEIGLDQEGKFIAIDITTLVQQWLGDDGQGANGLPNNGAAILAHPIDAGNPGVADLAFDSKENLQTSHEAQLNIQLRRSAGLQQVAPDASLTGDGTSAAPLGVATGGIGAVHLADNAVAGAKIADGAVTSAKIAAPLSLTSADPAFTLSVENTGAGAALRAGGAIDTTTQYNIGGQRVLSVAGVSNTFAGVGAGLSNTTGGANSFFGESAGLFNTTGVGNSFFGRISGRFNTTGVNNSFFGESAGLSNTTGSNNSFFGRFAGANNTTGLLNSFFGIAAGQSNTTGSSNSFFGSSTGRSNTTGINNSFFGVQAGFKNTTGASNSFFGSRAGENNTTGFRNSFFGVQAGQANTAGASNSFFGSSAGQNNTTGFGNSFFGDSAGLSNTTGGNNSFFGVFAGRSNTIGESNSFFGRSAGVNNTTGAHNSFFGFIAGQNNTAGFGNSFFGYQAGSSNTEGSSNASFGLLAGSRNTTGGGNSFFGAQAGENNTTGQFNAFFGIAAGRLNTTGNNNTFIGNGSGGNNTIESDNTYIGAGANGIAGVTQATAIGASALVSQSNSLVLGNVNVSVGVGTSAPKAKLHVAGKVYVEANGQGVILMSPGGRCFELTVTDAGTLTTAPVTCP